LEKFEIRYAKVLQYGAFVAGRRFAKPQVMRVLKHLI